MLDAMDHYGSILGSVLTAIFLVPVLGIVNTVVVNIVILIAVMGANLFLRKKLN